MLGPSSTEGSGRRGRNKQETTQEAVVPTTETDRRDTVGTVALPTPGRNLLLEETWSVGLLQHPLRGTNEGRRQGHSEQPQEILEGVLQERNHPVSLGLTQLSHLFEPVGLLLFHPADSVCSLAIGKCCLSLHSSDVYVVVLAVTLVL